MRAILTFRVLPAPDSRLILPWALEFGVAGANTALVTGVEASFSNVAGMAFVNRTELAVCNQQYLVGTDIQLNSAGFVQAVGGGHPRPDGPA